MISKCDAIRLAREAGLEVGRDAGGEYVAPQYSDSVGTLVRFAALVAAAEREARKAAQLEAIALREELTKHATQAEKDAYHRGVRDEREACARVCDAHTVDDVLAGIVIAQSCAAIIRARAEKGVT